MECKVICKTCEHVKKGFLEQTDWWKCKLTKRMDAVCNDGRGTARYGFCYEKNKDGNCQDWELKLHWWTRFKRTR